MGSCRRERRSYHRQSPSPLPVSGPAAAPGPNGVAHRGCRFGRAGTRQIGCGGLPSFRASCFETTLYDGGNSPQANLIGWWYKGDAPLAALPPPLIRGTTVPLLSPSSSPIRRVHANGSHVVVANGGDVATRVLPGHPIVVVSKLEGKPGKDGKDGWVPKILFTARGQSKGKPASE